MVVSGVVCTFPICTRGAEKLAVVDVELIPLLLSTAAQRRHIHRNFHLLFNGFLCHLFPSLSTVVGPPRDSEVGERNGCKWSAFTCSNAARQAILRCEGEWREWAQLYAFCHGHGMVLHGSKPTTRSRRWNNLTDFNA